MKTISSLLLILIISLNAFSQKKASRGDDLLYKAHNDLYFTRYYFKELADSLVERNLVKTFNIVSAKNIDRENISYSKYFAEYYYLKGYQAYHKNYNEKTIIYLDSAKVSLEKVFKNYNDTLKINKEAIVNCFIDDCSLNTISESISTLKNNSLRRIMEKLYISGRNTTYNISRMNYIRSQFSEEENAINKIYSFANLTTCLKKRDCVTATKYFNTLDYPVKCLTFNAHKDEIQLLQDIMNENATKKANYHSKRMNRDCEDETLIPDVYDISNYPNEQEIKQSQIYLLKSCPQDTLVFASERISNLAYCMSASSRLFNHIQELNDIPFTDENSQIDIPPVIFSRIKNKNLGSVDSLFVHYLKLGGYDPSENISYYTYKGGFAMLTSLEMIKDNGTPFSPQERFSLKKIKNNSTKEFFRTLFMGNKGYYRFIIFVVSTEKIITNGSSKILTYPESNILQSLGAMKLPTGVFSSELTKNYKGKAFVYVFRKSDMGETPDPEFEVLSSSGYEQFKNSNLSNFIDK